MCSGIATLWGAKLWVIENIGSAVTRTTTAIAGRKVPASAPVPGPRPLDPRRRRCRERTPWCAARAAARYCPAILIPPANARAADSSSIAASNASISIPQPGLSARNRYRNESPRKTPRTIAPSTRLAPPSSGKPRPAIRRVARRREATILAKRLRICSRSKWVEARIRPAELHDSTGAVRAPANFGGDSEGISKAHSRTSRPAPSTPASFPSLP